MRLWLLEINLLRDIFYCGSFKIQNVMTNKSRNGIEDFGLYLELKISELYNLISIIFC